jgi:hypothetical protein
MKPLTPEEIASLEIRPRFMVALPGGSVYLRPIFKTKKNDSASEYVRVCVEDVWRGSNWFDERYDHEVPHCDVLSALRETFAALVSEHGALAFVDLDDMASIKAILDTMNTPRTA